MDHDRNLCIDGGFDICAEMYNKNILVPLKTFVPKVSIQSRIVYLTRYILFFSAIDLLYTF